MLRNILGKRYLISLPFMGYSGLLSNSLVAERKLIEKAILIGKKYEVQYIELRQFHPVSLIETNKNNYVSPILRLQANENEVLQGLIKARLRSKIRQSIRKGVKTFYGTQYIDDFYHIFVNTMHRLGTPVHPKSLFIKIAEVFPNDVIFLIAKVKNIVTSGMVLFNFENRILSNPWASSLLEFSRFQANVGMYWGAIKYGCHNGFEYFDFGRSTIDAGTYNFKKQWGTKPQPLYYQYVMLKTDNIPVVNTVGNKYEKAIELWRRLPYGFTRSFGSRVVKYLPEL